ncbi:hypothetical protein [Pseudomonas shahriarae]|uniref:hypothetical protein n=1 Tax=Pseudomonas shahriarae TaxID=2745512 RepID=UPI002361450A|nr:hypothetical protein [Pseudomonas shahriarae]MDD1135710.1 hypothetical protein [Pseudomonas shahriarae]
MNSTKTERTTYHLINLENQAFFSGSVDDHKSLGMDKTQLMSAISNQAAQPFGEAYEKTSVLSADAQTSPKEFDRGAEHQTMEVEVPLPASVENAAVPEVEAGDSDAVAPDMQSQDDFERLIASNVSHDTEYLLQDVQDTLGSLTGMANRLAEQKKDTLKQQKTLHSRDVVLQEKERLLSVKEEDLRQLHKQLLHDRSLLAQEAESNAQVIAERSASLQQLAESLEARERASARRAELLQQENTRTDELSTLLRARLAQLQKRENELERRGQELNENLKQLKSAKDRFSTIVKSFNETVNLGNESKTTESRAELSVGSGYVESV